MSKKRNSTFGASIRRMFTPHKEEKSLLEEEQMQSPFRTIVKNFVSNKLAMIGVIVFLLIFLSCMIIPIFAPFDPLYQDTTQQNVSPGFNMMDYPSELKGNVKQISVGSTFAVGLDNDGKVYVWGKTSNGEDKIPEFRNPIVQVAAGMTHILALDEKGNVYTWGYNRMQLDMIPQSIKEFGVTQIAAGQQISFALCENGKLYYWGNENIISLQAADYQGQIAKIAPNADTVVALLKDGRVVALTKKDTPYSRVPEDLTDVVDIVSTDKSAAALTADGRVVVWGAADYDVYDIPEEIQGHVTQLSAGRTHFSALLDDGTVAAWGRNNFGQSDPPALTGIVELESGYFQNYAIDEDGNIHTWGLKGYMFGSDERGRDVLGRLLTGGRMTMTIGAIAVIISTIIGIIIGGISGYFGGKVDMLLMRLTEIVMSIPFLPFAMILSAILGSSVPETARISMIMIILGLLSWPSLARLVRAQILAEREKEFVTAAKAMGIRELGIVFRHILPNVITVIIVNTTLDFATCMLTESSLSFLGFGVVEPSPTWGNMLTSAQSSTVIGEYWWRWVFPSLALGFSTISINAIGDGLRDAIDPRSNER